MCTLNTFCGRVCNVLSVSVLVSVSWFNVGFLELLQPGVPRVPVCQCLFYGIFMGPGGKGILCIRHGVVPMILVLLVKICIKAIEMKSGKLPFSCGVRLPL